MNKFALITGASRGLGLAVSKYLARQQYDLALIARNAEHLQAAAREIAAINRNIQITTHALDLQDATAAAALTDEIIQAAGRIDVLFNNAGILLPGTDEIAMDDCARMFHINVRAPFVIASRVVQVMAAQQSGYIFNVASMAGRRGVAELGAYSATKHAVVGFSDSLHKKYCAAGVKVTVICPSVVDTDMTQHMSMANQVKIPVDDIVKTVDYLLSLSKNTEIPVAELQCRALINSNATVLFEQSE